MNPFIQQVLVVVTLLCAVWFLISKYFITKKVKKDKDCGDGSCGC